MKFNLPINVQCILNRLSQCGYDAYIVGGSTRDMLLNLPPKDFDINTNAKPKDILRVFKDFKTFDTGIKHGTVSVVMDKEVYEITTYRVDGEYYDNRHPKQVNFTSDLQLDLSRRDFTINAMAYNPKIGLVDFFGGQEDLNNKVIRTVGDADIRFNEDALRIIRGLRFASVYGFTIEDKTKKAILSNKELLNNISKERISAEFIKLLCGKNAVNILRDYREVFGVIIPELKPMFDFNQNNKHHDKDLWEHTLCSIDNTECDPVLRMTLLLHDIGKPASEYKDENGVSHYNNHQKAGEMLSEKILTDLRFSKEFINKVTLLISIHDNYIEPNKVAVKKLLNLIGEDNFAYYLKIQYADKTAQSSFKKQEKINRIRKTESIFNKVIENGECYSLKQLAVTGRDLIDSGIKSGREVGNLLDELLQLVIEEKCPNTKSELLAYIKKADG
jgi:tRNA nucleotidyltransferase (CCA-adding enzyme)